METSCSLVHTVRSLSIFFSRSQPEVREVMSGVLIQCAFDLARLISKVRSSPTANVSLIYDSMIRSRLLGVSCPAYLPQCLTPREDEV